MKKNNNLTSFAEHLDSQHGKIGTPSREIYDQEFEAFKLGVLIQKMREKQNLTQEHFSSKVRNNKILHFTN